MDDYYMVIMAGGGGTRLWPLSRKSRPKQSLNLFDGRTLFQMAVERLLPLVPAERILIATVPEQIDLLRSQAPAIPKGNFLPEPSPKGTAAVIGLAATYLDAVHPDAVMANLTADHLITEGGRFRELLQAAYQVARHGQLVTLGIRPTHPSTGYGYIHFGAEIGEYGGFRVYESLGFTEKPPLERARAFLTSGDYAWNSGMFIWRVGRVLEEIGRWMPALAGALAEYGHARGEAGEREVLGRAWARLENQTIDYGVMEKADGVAVIEAGDLGWHDIGTWDRLIELGARDEHGNLARAADSILLNTHDSMVFQQALDGESRLIAVLGMQDVVIVDTGDALLICHRRAAESVKALVKELEDRGKGKYL
jgi:mannose-1-phosphate guanylyltransferase